MRNYLKKLVKPLLGKISLGSLDPIYKQLRQAKDISNLHSIVRQFRSNSPYVDYHYKHHLIRTINEPSSLYHIINSTAKMEKLADSCSNNQKGVMLDIGANIGLFSYFYKKKYPTSVIYLFEPDKRLIPIIEKNLEGFGNYKIFNNAIGAETAVLKLFINTKSSQTNSLLKEAVTPFAKPDDIIEQNVDVINLSDFCLKHKIESINTLKIDIQGGEYDVFKSSLDLLERTKEVFVEVCFIGNDTVKLVKLLDTYYKKYTPLNQVYMGADLKFYN